MTGNGSRAIYSRRSPQPHARARRRWRTRWTRLCRRRLRFGPEPRGRCLPPQLQHPALRQSSRRAPVTFRPFDNFHATEFAIGSRDEHEARHWYQLLAWLQQLQNDSLRFQSNDDITLSQYATFHDYVTVCTRRTSPSARPAMTNLACARPSPAIPRLPLQCGRRHMYGSPAGAGPRGGLHRGGDGRSPRNRLPPLHLPRIHPAQGAEAAEGIGLLTSHSVSGAAPLQVENAPRPVPGAPSLRRDVG